MEDYYLGKASERIFLPLIRKTVPEIVDMHFPAEGIFHNIVIISIDKRYPGHARKIMNAVWGLGQLMFSKTVIVVDKDVDVQNLSRGGVDRRHAYRSGARHPVHARAGGRSRGRERSARRTAARWGSTPRGNGRRRASSGRGRRGSRPPKPRAGAPRRSGSGFARDGEHECNNRRRSPGTAGRP